MNTKAGMITEKNGRVLPFNDWYYEKYKEAPTRENIGNKIKEKTNEQERSFEKITRTIQKGKSSCQTK